LGLAKKANTRHVTTFYGVDVNRYPVQEPIWRKRYRELFNRGDLFLCEGTHMAACLEKLGCPREKIRVQHLGVEIERIAYQPRVLTAEEPLRVLMASSFTEKKGIPYGIAALAAITKEMPVELTIIGDASSRPEGQVEKGKIIKAIEESGLRARTRFMGYQTHKRFLEEASEHHLFLSPSVTAKDGDTEGGAPVSIIEMAATGMPVVSTTHCDIPEVLDYGEDGWLAQERDVSGLTFIIRQWLAHTDRWPELLARARAHIEVGYDVVKQGQRLAQIYRSLCS
jgi:colanic acid/amylovoran biosynthesis glycosyltransferase